MALPIAAGIGAASGLLSGVMAADAQRSQNAQNKDMMRMNQDFQERMSSTAYQRAAQDMDAAGLNRNAMAGASPASSPSGTSAQMVAEDGMSKGVASATASALEALRTKKDLQMADSQTELNKAAYNAKDSERHVSDNMATKLANDIAIQRANWEANQADASAKKAEAKTREEAAKFQSKTIKANDGFQKFDAINQRVNQAAGTVSNAVNAFMPKLKIQSTTNEQYDRQGEHIGTTTRRNNYGR